MASWPDRTAAGSPGAFQRPPGWPGWLHRRGNGDRRYENKADRAPTRSAGHHAAAGSLGQGPDALRWAPACSGNQFCDNSASGAEPFSIWRGRSNQRQPLNPQCQFALRQPRYGPAGHQGRAHLPPARTRSDTLKQPSAQGATDSQASGA